MSLRTLFARLDLQIAILLFLVSGALSAYAYARILQDEMPSQSLVPSFPGGAHRYALMSEKGCVGQVRTSLRFEEDQYKFDLKGTFRIRVLDKVLASEISGFAGFNSIGQLGGSAFTIRADKLFLRFGTRDINPISLVMRMVNDKQHFEYQAFVPGPISIKENRDRSYRLEYLHFGKIAANYLPMLEHPALKAIKVTSLEQGDGQDLCSSSSEVLDASLVANFIGLMSQP